MNICTCVYTYLDFTGDSVSKESACNAGDPGTQVRSLDQERRPGGGNGNPLRCSCLEKESYGKGSLAGYSPRGCNESDMSEAS